MTPRPATASHSAPQSAPGIEPSDFTEMVLGPIYAEFCLRLWAMSALLEKPQQSALLFCARGGLRMQFAYEHFLKSTGLVSPVKISPLMISRIVAVRGPLIRAVQAAEGQLLPAAATIIRHEFANRTVRSAAAAVAGVDQGILNPVWDVTCTPESLIEFLRHPDGQRAVDAMAKQQSLFSTHLRETLGERTQAILVDTGFYGSTRELLAEGHPEIDFGSLMLAKSFRPGSPERFRRTFGLLVEAESYSPVSRRTVLLRYWHFVEWLFEPAVPSVRKFGVVDGRVRSNLEVDGWLDRIPPEPGHAFSGVMRYIDGLPRAGAARIVEDADRAWTMLRRAIVWPAFDDSLALEVGRRTHDFGSDASWTARPWHGPIAAVRGSTMWREGEIAHAKTPLRLPLLLAIETAYTVRLLRNRLRRRRSKQG